MIIVNDKHEDFQRAVSESTPEGQESLEEFKKLVLDLGPEIGDESDKYKKMILDFASKPGPNTTNDGIAKPDDTDRDAYAACKKTLAAMGYHCDSLPKQIRFDDIIEKYRIGLAAVELGHLVGSISYEPFSWYNSPETSDSTPENNLNALYRHMCAFEKGTVIDDNSLLPHPVHMACRSAMLVSVIYKEQNNCGNIVAKFDDNEQHFYAYATNQSPDRLLFGHLLTSAEYYALSQVDDDAVTDAPASFYIRLLHGELALLGKWLRRLRGNPVSIEHIKMGVVDTAEAIFRDCLLLVAAWFRTNKNKRAFYEAIRWYERYKAGKYKYISTYSYMNILPLFKNIAS